jgi:hypothetical protein
MPNLPEVTIAILLRGEPPAEALLGLEKRGIGLGLHTGIGGRVESGETPFRKMWHDYSFWLRRALQDQDVTATFIYSLDNKTVASVQQGVARSTFEAAQQLAEADPAGGAFRGA